MQKAEKQFVGKNEINIKEKNDKNTEFFIINKNYNNKLDKGSFASKNEKKEINNKLSQINVIGKNIFDDKKHKNLEIISNESYSMNKKYYKTITLYKNNKYKTKKILNKKYYKSTNNTKRRYLAKNNNSCSNIDFYKPNLITKAIKSKSPKNTFLVFNTININIGNTNKSFKRNKTPRIQVMKNISSSLKNIYLNNELLFESVKFNCHLNEEIREKKRSYSNKKIIINTLKNKK